MGLTKEDEILRERRARLAAERKLEQKQRELSDANRKLSNHALNLSGQIVDQRKVVQELEGENTRTAEDLRAANDKVVMVERLLWNAIETIHDGFALFDADYRLITANQRYLRTFEGSDIGVGSNFVQILDFCIEEGLVDLREQPEDEWFSFMLERWSAPKIEPTVLRLWDGSYVRMADRRTGDGGIVSMAMDITDTIRREEELRQARDVAEAADRAKSAFLAKMSHELRTPMNGVVGMADLLLDSTLEEDDRVYAQTIRNSGEALLQIINDILDFSKIEAERLELKPEPFDLERLLRDVAVMIEPTLQGKPVSFSVDYDLFLPTQFVGDAGRLRQVLTNLIGNAVKFTEEGFVLVRIVGMPGQDADHRQISISVEDSGIGIDADKLDHVFGEFNQVEDESNRKYEGTGLGLAITRGLVEQMGGEVWVESEKGRGSCFGFCVELPVAEDDTTTDLVMPEGMSRGLVIGNEDLDRQLLIRQLGVLGLSVEATTLEDLASSAQPCDLVFFDAEGHDSIPDEITRRAEGMPLILVGRGRQSTLREAGSHFLLKPILRNCLYDVIRDLAGAADANTAETPETPEPPAAQDQKLRVLAAEDNKTNQMVFRAMLKGLDIDLTLVENGEQAVAAYRELQPDLVFMDISMPVMDGMEATRSIRSMEAEKGSAEVPIVAMTAHAMKGDEARIREAGVSHYLVKPMKKDKILDAIETYRGDKTV